MQTAIDNYLKEKKSSTVPGVGVRRGGDIEVGKRDLNLSVPAGPSKSPSSSPRVQSGTLNPSNQSPRVQYAEFGSQPRSNRNLAAGIQRRNTVEAKPRAPQFDTDNPFEIKNTPSVEAEKSPKPAYRPITPKTSEPTSRSSTPIIETDYNTPPAIEKGNNIPSVPSTTATVTVTSPPPVTAKNPAPVTVKSPSTVTVTSPSTITVHSPIKIGATPRTNSTNNIANIGNPFDDEKAEKPVVLEPSPKSATTNPSTSTASPSKTDMRSPSPKPEIRSPSPKPEMRSPSPKPDKEASKITVSPAPAPIKIGATPRTGSTNYVANPFDDADTGNPFENSTGEEESWFSLENVVSLENTIHDLLYKVIIIGASGVGKTNLLSRWLDNKFGDKSATINVEFAVKAFKVQDKFIKVQLWDTAGQEQYRAVTRSYYRSARGAIIVYDVSKSDTFDDLDTWLQDVRDAPGNENTQILLIGNKTDLEDHREIPTERGLEYARKNNINFMETSARSGSNVDKAFKILLTDIHKANTVGSIGIETPTSNPTGGIVIGQTTTTHSDDCCEGPLESVKALTNSWFN
jgi:small GTP-binding protein